MMHGQKNIKLIPICHLLALLGAHRILHVSRIRVKMNEALPPPPYTGPYSHATEFSPPLSHYLLTFTIV